MITRRCRRDNQHARLVEAEGDVREPVEAPHEKPRGCDENKRECDLRDNEPAGNAPTSMMLQTTKTITSSYRT